VRVKFKDNPRVHLFSFGVSDRDGTEKINLHDNASSLFAVGTGSMDIKMRDAAAVIRDLQIKKIDLLKLNIEGGEFKVLPRMIECGLISLCTDIQVQFHDFYPDAKRLRDDIRAELSKTHYLTYDYPFTFENWRKNA
jgi:FkbM family methyltransferase